jgi:RNA polymerase sigma-70 factor (ECF subfamily)
MHTTPPSLLERLRLPNPAEAWDRFVGLYTPSLYTWARQTGLQETDADDLVQDVLTTLVLELPRFQYDARKSFRAWLKTITLNRWRDQRRRQSARPRSANGAALQELAAPDEASGFAETEYQQQLVARAIQLMQQDFEPNTWKACWELVVNGRPAGEVAAQLGIREGTVYSAKCRVLRRLRQELDGMLE